MNKKKLKIAIVGAGGIGCYYGARLLAQGHDVVFIARGKHLSALMHEGLTLTHPDFHYSGAVKACSLENLHHSFTPDEFDALLICVKATATTEIAENLNNWFVESQQQCAVISLQNGVDNETMLEKYLGKQCIIGGLAVKIGGHVISPGNVAATGIAEIMMGVWPNAEKATDNCFSNILPVLASAFQQAAIPARVVDNIRHEIWRKLVINNGVNPLSALTEVDTRTLSHDPLLGKVVYELMKEAAAVAIADGETLTERDATEMFELIRQFDAIKTSMLVDLEKGRYLEIEAIGGAVLERSRQLNMSVPYTETIYALLKHKMA